MSSTQTEFSEGFWWWVSLLLLFMLSVGVWYSGSLEFRTEPLPGGELVSTATTPAQAWRVQTDPANVQFDTSGITLSLDEPGQAQVKLFQAVDPSADARKNAEMVWVSGRIDRLSGEGHIADPQRRPRLLVRSTIEGEPDHLGPVIYASGRADQQSFSSLVRTSQHADQFEISWRIREPGSWRLSELRMESVITSPEYELTVKILALLSVLLAGYLLHRLARFLDGRQWWLLVTGLFMLLLFVMLAGPVMREVMGSLRRLLEARLPDEWVVSEYLLQKLGHMCIFIFLSMRFLALRQRLRMSATQVVFLLVGLAFYTEAVQRHLLERNGNLMDVAIDSTGIFLGFLAWSLFSRMQSTRRGMSVRACRIPSA